MGAEASVEGGALFDEKGSDLSCDGAGNECGDQNWNHFYHLLGFFDLGDWT